ncbi:putative integral membrane protein [Corynebacterium mustelae]|uniref:Putative integral membrane protein n=1 Tax=Corynebacterium mustelae TaxID=571915 RepID=A0A0G3H0K4_9CORY|nr:zf-HC2 domain-containing protein [Corynebacterium mustelae]AKK05348.1 putative integral membrane protein [Corynebacterium mustelae]
MINCEQIQAAVSARLDGEHPTIDDDIIDAHLQACSDCQSFLEKAAIFNRRLSFDVSSHVPAPDLAEEIIAGVEPTWRSSASTRALSVALSRLANAIVGVLWVLWAVFLLGVSGVSDSDPMFAELVVETAAMRCALGFGLLFAAWQTRVVGGILPLYGALWMFSLGFGIRDVVVGAIMSESLIGLGLLLVSVISLSWSWIAVRGWASVRSNVLLLSASPMP